MEGNIFEGRTQANASGWPVQGCPRQTMDCHLRTQKGHSERALACSCLLQAYE